MEAKDAQIAALEVENAFLAKITKAALRGKETG
jgi:hypothetical protein